MSYLLPSPYAATKRNRAIHPDFMIDEKDQVFLEWIKIAFERRNLDHYGIREAGYDYLNHQISR